MLYHVAIEKGNNISAAVAESLVEAALLIRDVVQCQEIPRLRKNVIAQSQEFHGHVISVKEFHL